jgi:hypothetical protein
MSLANQGESASGIAAVKIPLDDLLDDRPEKPALIRFAPEDCKACIPARTGSHTPTERFAYKLEPRDKEWVNLGREESPDR